jgi:hypothetical protein
MVSGSIERGQVRSLAVQRAIGKAQAAPDRLLRERHSLPSIPRRAQFLFVHCSRIGNPKRVRPYQARKNEA